MKYIALISLMSTSLNCFAFGDLGHSTVGYIAEKNMSAESKYFVLSIMGGEPMAVSATWPDHVRSDERYNGFAPYHFFDFPESYSYESLPQNYISPKSADTILIKAPRLLKKRKLDVLQKQVIFRYFVHVLGDIHQPLHVGNTLDMGGNLCDVMVPQGMNQPLKKMNIHSFWDSELPGYLKAEVMERAKVLGKKISYYTYKDLGDYLMEDAASTGVLKAIQAEVKPGKRVEWLAESKALHPEVYPDGKSVAPKDRAYCKFLNIETGKVEDGKYDSSKLPILTPEYIKKSLVLVKKRIILAGLRLQSEIDEMSKGKRKWTAKDEEKFFKAIMPEKSINDRVPSSKKKDVKVLHLEHGDCDH